MSVPLPNFITPVSMDKFHERSILDEVLKSDCLEDVENVNVIVLSGAETSILINVIIKDSPYRDEIINQIKYLVMAYAQVTGICDPNNVDAVFCRTDSKISYLRNGLFMNQVLTAFSY